MASNKVRVAAASISISAAALIGIAVSEGYVGQTYKDIGGVLTIGFGETSGVKEGQRTDPVRALIKLNESAAAHARAPLKPPAAAVATEKDAVATAAPAMGSDNDGKRHGKPSGALLCRFFVALLGIAFLVWTTVRAARLGAVRTALTPVASCVWRIMPRADAPRCARSTTRQWWPRSRRRGRRRGGRARRAS